MAEEFCGSVEVNDGAAVVYSDGDVQLVIRPPAIFSKDTPVEISFGDWPKGAAYPNELSDWHESYAKNLPVKKFEVDSFKFKTVPGGAGKLFVFSAHFGHRRVHSAPFQVVQRAAENFTSAPVVVGKQQRRRKPKAEQPREFITKDFISSANELSKTITDLKRQRQILEGICNTHASRLNTSLGKLLRLCEHILELEKQRKQARAALDEQE